MELIYVIIVVVALSLLFELTRRLIEVKCVLEELHGQLQNCTDELESLRSSVDSIEEAGNKLRRKFVPTEEELDEENENLANS